MVKMSINKGMDLLKKILTWNFILQKTLREKHVFYKVYTLYSQGIEFHHKIFSEMMLYTSTKILVKKSSKSVSKVMF